MNSLIKTQTAISPSIEFHSVGQMKLVGNSILNDARDFYTDLSEWVSAYCKNPAQKTIISFKSSELSHSSEKEISQLFTQFNQLGNSRASAINCIWYYDAHASTCKTFVQDLAKEMKAVNFILQPQTIEFAR